MAGGPWDDYATPDNVAQLVTTEATRQGVDPQLALRVAMQESRLHPGAVSPKGAVGVMQLMPDTARGMGVDPADLGDNIKGGVAYLKQQVDTFHDPKLAAAAYNAGPEAVRKHGGVPPYAETQHYVQAVAPGEGQPETPPWLDYGSAPPPARAAAAKPRPPPMLPAAAAKPNVMADVGKSYVTGVKQGGYGLADQLAAVIPGLSMVHRFASDVTNAATHQAPTANPDFFNHIASMLLPDHAPQTWQGRTALTAGQMTPAAFGAEGSIPARLANVLIPTATSSAAGETARAMHASPMVEQIARTVGAMGGGLAASARFAPKAARAPNILGDVKQARDEAYSAVRNSGDVIPQSDVKDLAGQFADLVKAKGGPDPKAYPASLDMAARLKAMAKSKDGVTLDQLDTVRSDAYESLVKPSDRESPLGVTLRGMIDDVIDKTGNPVIQKARDLHTRAMKIEDIQNEVTSARMRAATANSGQNVNNSIRQELRPLIDPTRNQQITNLTPDELTALTKAVMGSKGQNMARDASNILRNRFLQGMLALPTAGAAPVGMEVAGRMLNRGAENGTMANVQKVIDLIAAGHPGSAAAPIVARSAPLLAAPRTGSLPLAALLSVLPLAATARTAKKPAAQQRR